MKSFPSLLMTMMATMTLVFFGLGGVTMSFAEDEHRHHPEFGDHHGSHGFPGFSYPGFAGQKTAKYGQKTAAQANKGVQRAYGANQKLAQKANQKGKQKY